MSLLAHWTGFLQQQHEVAATAAWEAYDEFPGSEDPPDLDAALKAYRRVYDEAIRAMLRKLAQQLDQYRGVVSAAHVLQAKGARDRDAVDRVIAAVIMFDEAVR